MPVAEHPCEPGQDRNVGPDLDEGLGLRHDLDYASVIEQQHVVGSQDDRLRKVEFDASAFSAEHEAALHAALLGVEDERIGDLATRFVPGQQLFHAWHRLRPPP